MHSVLCGIDESGSHEAVGAAIEYCRENGARLGLVGIVKDKFNDTTKGGAGERVRRYKTVKSELERAGRFCADGRRDGNHGDPRRRSDT